MPKPSAIKTQAKTHYFLAEPRKTTAEIQNALTDPELYALCKKCGTEALQARRKFIGLLPEVNARRLYERRKFRSLYHFAAALGGVGKRLVDEVLRLEKRFADMPKLHAALVNGEIGLSKLARVVSIVDVDNEAEICEKIRLLSRRAVDVLVKEMMAARGEVLSSGVLFENQFAGDGRDEAVNLHDSCENILTTYGKIANAPAENCNFQQKTEAPDHGVKNQDGSRKPQTSPKTPSGRGDQRAAIQSCRGQNFDYEILNALSPEVKAKLKELIDKEIDINSILLNAISEREAEIAQKKAEIGKTPAKSRHIPVKIISIIREEFGSKCAYPNCQNPAEQIHHEKPFARHQDHDPLHLKPLCRGHHELEHAKSATYI